MGALWLPLLILSCLPALTLAEWFNLSGLQWTLKNQNGSIAIPGSVPSQAHLDLLKAGIITEPLLGINGMEFRLSFCSMLTYYQISARDGSLMRIGLILPIYRPSQKVSPTIQRGKVRSWCSMALIPSQIL